VTGDRKRFGLMLDKPVWDNVAQVRAIALRRDGMLIRKGSCAPRRERTFRRCGFARALPTIRPGASRAATSRRSCSPSGSTPSSIMVLDDPTRGVDVGAKHEMHALFRAAADGNALILFASTDLDELAEVCDRVLVFFRGTVGAQLDGERLTVRDILESMNTGSLAAAA